MNTARSDGIIRKSTFPFNVIRTLDRSCLFASQKRTRILHQDQLKQSRSGWQCQTWDVKGMWTLVHIYK